VILLQKPSRAFGLNQLTARRTRHCKGKRQKVKGKSEEGKDSIPFIFAFSFLFFLNFYLLLFTFAFASPLLMPHASV
jgi:hypothetical protein